MSKRIISISVLLLSTVSLQAYDFNQDGTPDLLMKNDLGHLKTWELDSSFAKSERWLTNLGSSNWEVYEDIIDLDNDGDVDILVQDQTTGYIKAIKMNSFTKEEYKWVTNPGGADWKIVGLNDIDGDSYPDIILQQTSTGYIKSITLNTGISAGSSKWIGNPGGADWEVDKVVDVDNDNIADIVMQHNTLGYIKAFKLSNDFSVTSKWIGNPGGADWETHGIADIDGDGVKDIVMQNTTSGYIKAYKLDSTFKGTSKWVGNPGGLSWMVKGIEDIDGDGIKDVVIQHSSLGYVKAYKLNSSFLGNSKWVGNPSGSDWEFVAVKDINDNGVPDIVFQNKTLGYVKAFNMESSFTGSSTWIGNPGGSSWKIYMNEEESETENSTLPPLPQIPSI